MGADGSWSSSGGEEDRIISCEDHAEDMINETIECSSTSPLEIGNLRVTSLGVFQNRNDADIIYYWMIKCKLLSYLSSDYTIEQCSRVMLCYTCLVAGKIVCDSMHFHDKKHIWPEGYTAFRMFTSIKGDILLQIISICLI